ncbi:MAG: gliding motility protein GldC [Saprospiraceae bacterium]|nr:gliding motility protein GldC [Saprospiraceae bacterium]
MSEKKSTIKIDITLDKEKMPRSIKWSATDIDKEVQDAKAMLLSFFDAKSKETLKIDLWTTEMQVVEMDRLIYQTIRALADSYYKATNNNKLAGAMQQFAKYFGEESEIIPKEKKNQ